MERGDGWINAVISFWSVDPRQYLIALVRAVVDVGRLPTFALTDSEKAFFMHNNVSTLGTPTFILGDNTGYNTANYLLGLSSILLLFLFPRDLTLCLT